MSKQATQETIIKNGRLSGNFLKELSQFRELIYYFTWREFKVRYKQTAIGVLWVIFQPIFFTLVITLLLFRAINVDFGNQALPAILPVYAGLIFWNYFEQSLNNASNSLVNNQSIITKVYFPRFIPILSAALAGLVDFIFAFLVIIPMAIIFNVPLNFVGMLSAVPLIFAAFLTVFGAGMFLATLNIRFRDVKFALPFMMRILLFTTPVFYPISFLPSYLHGILYINPITAVIELFRGSALPLESAVKPEYLIISLASIVTMLIVGMLYFRAKEREFADIA